MIDKRERLIRILDENPYLSWTNGQLADYLMDNDVEVKHYCHFNCEYDKETGLTSVTCSVCGDTRDIDGCYINVEGEPIYFEDNYCPCCGGSVR